MRQTVEHSSWAGQGLAGIGDPNGLGAGNTDGIKFPIRNYSSVVRGDKFMA